MRRVYNVGSSNASELPPQYYHLGPLTYGPVASCYVAPPRSLRGLMWPHHVSTPNQRHEGARVDSRGPTTRPRQIIATQALAWARVALPHGLACHVASAWVPRRPTSACGPCGRITPFLPFFKKNEIYKNQNKFWKNPEKCKKFRNQYL